MVQIFGSLLVLSVRLHEDDFVGVLRSFSVLEVD